MAVVALVVIVVSCKLAMHMDLESKIQRALQPSLYWWWPMVSECLIHGTRVFVS